MSRPIAVLTSLVITPGLVLHNVLSAPMFAALASMFPAPLAVVVSPIVATFGLVVVLAAVPTIAILSAEGQGADTKNHQQAKYQDFLHKQVSPFRVLLVAVK